MTDLTGNDLECLYRYAQGNVGLTSPPQATMDRLMAMGYLEQKLGGIGITDRGMQRLLKEKPPLS